jgi:hypothetical protein
MKKYKIYSNNVLMDFQTGKNGEDAIERFLRTMKIQYPYNRLKREEITATESEGK